MYLPTGAMYDIENKRREHRFESKSSNIRKEGNNNVDNDLYHLHDRSIRKISSIRIKRSLGAYKDPVFSDLPPVHLNRTGFKGTDLYRFAVLDHHWNHDTAHRRNRSSDSSLKKDAGLE